MVVYNGMCAVLRRAEAELIFVRRVKFLFKEINS